MSAGPLLAEPEGLGWSIAVNVKASYAPVTSTSSGPTPAAGKTSSRACTPATVEYRP